jgi:hypothetical protein
VIGSLRDESLSAQCAPRQPYLDRANRLLAYHRANRPLDAGAIAGDLRAAAEPSPCRGSRSGAKPTPCCAVATRRSVFGESCADPVLAITTGVMMARPRR